MRLLLDNVINVKFALEMKDFQGRNVFYLATVYGTLQPSSSISLTFFLF
jgi:hypothetical protein